MRRSLQYALLLMLVAPAGLFGQTTGTATVTGTTPTAVSITDTSNVQNFGSTINFASLTPGSGGLVTANTVVRLRSNSLYKLSVRASALNYTNPSADSGGAAISLSDIGFRIDVANTGVLVADSGIRMDAVVAGYGDAFPAVTNGLTPAFSRSLNDVAGGDTQILSGPRISARGDISTDSNFISVTLNVGTVPQYFTPNASFSTVITLTMAPGP